MRAVCWTLLIAGFTLTAGEQLSADGEKPRTAIFELRDGDRVVLLGNTLVERAQQYGYWETLLTARYPRRRVVFRNLGWSGDTVWAESRVLFDTPAKGYARMLAHISKLKPTVVVLGYGGNEANAGRAGLRAFVKQYNRLLDDLTAASAPGVRFVILSPIRHENLGSPLPDPTRTNRKLALWTRTLGDIAQRRGCRFVDLFSPWKLPPEFTGRVPGGVPKHLTDDEMHLTAAGYFVTGVRIASSLSLLTPPADIRLTAEGRVVRSSRAKISQLRVSGGRLSFQYQAETLHGLAGRLQIDGAPTRGYALRIDGKRTVSATGRRWQSGVVLTDSPDVRQWERLRKAIVEKNRLYFYRWRPQNVTYLFLFRKHEQGQNAREIPLFDPLVAAKEKEIARLRQPIPHTSELAPLSR